MSEGSTASNGLGRGAVAGVAGTVVMTAFQKFVEMPITGRSDSYAPAEFAEKVFRLTPGTPAARRRLNNATHLSLGTMWGAAYALAARAGLRGPRAVAAVFVTVYAGDVLLNTALGLYRPQDWSGRGHRVPASPSRTAVRNSSWTRSVVPSAAQPWKYQVDGVPRREVLRQCRHEHPVRSTYKIASTIRRRGWITGRPPPRAATIGSINAHCSSVRSGGRPGKSP